MPTQRQRVVLRFNSGTDAGGEDPRITSIPLTKTENLYQARGILVQREGTTEAFRSARPFVTSEGTYVITDRQSSVRRITSSFTIANTRTNYDTGYLPTLWKRVGAIKDINATANGWATLTPLIYSQANGGFNAYVSMNCSLSGGVVTSNVSIHDADRDAVINSITSSCNSNAVALLYDSSDGRVYYLQVNNNQSAVVYRTCNITSTSLTWAANASVTGLPNNLRQHADILAAGILRYQKDPVNDPAVYVKRLGLAYYGLGANANAVNACAVFINTSTMALGAETNETSSYTVALTTNAANSIPKYVVTADAGLRSADTTWRMSTNAQEVAAFYYPNDDNTFGTVRTLFVNTAASTFTFSSETNTELATSVVRNIVLGDGPPAKTYSVFGDSEPARVTNNYALAPNLCSIWCPGSTSGRPFSLGTAVTNTVTLHQVAFTGGAYQHANVAQLKASLQAQTVLLTEMSNGRSALSSRLLIGTTFCGQDGINTYPAVVASKEWSRLAGYSYGNSDYTNAYYVTAIERTATTKSYVLFRMEDEFEDQQFSTSISPIRGGAILAGGSPQLVTGGAFRPIGYVEYPEGVIASITGNTSTNSYRALGKIGFCATYEYQDAAGLLVRSAPSPTTSVSLTNVQNAMSVKVVGPHLSGRFFALGTPHFTVFYRTEPNGTIFYECARVRYDSNDEFALATVNAENFFAADAFSSISSLRPLYTQTESENIFPYPHAVGATFQDRYIYADTTSSGSTDLYYSKPLSPGISIEFNEFLRLPVPAAGGPVTALHQLGDKLIIFKNRQIYATYGDGFNAALGGQNFAPPQQITSSVGCTNRNCVAPTPNGLLFLCGKEIWGLTQDGQIAQVGRPVAYYTETYTYTCAAYNPLRKHTIFVSADTNAPALVYSYETGTWSTFSGNYAGKRYIACDTNGVDYFGGGDNTSATFSTTVAGNSYNSIYYSAANSTETMNIAVESAWINLQGLLGESRWKKTTLFMENKTKHTLEKKTAYDGDPYWTPEDTEQFYTNTLATYDYTTHLGTMANAALADQTYKIEFSGSRQKTDSLRHGFYASNVAGNTISFIGMALEFTPRGGNKRLGPDKKIG